MKMLVAIDRQDYSGHAAREAARFATNTWADVTLLGLSGDDRGDEVDSTLKNYFELFAGDSSPYGAGGYSPLEKTSNGVWEVPPRSTNGRKKLRILAREGDARGGILAQAREEEADFIVIGSAKEGGSEWIGEINLPQKLASAAPCSVLVVKEEKTPKTVVCLLDHDHVSQESLEMINQFVTLHDAELEIVGVAGAKGLRGEVEGKMNEVLSYYSSRGVRSWVKLVKAEDLRTFATSAAKTSLIGLWLGKKSLLRKIFSTDVLEELVGGANSSVLILK